MLKFRLILLYLTLLGLSACADKNKTILVLAVDAPQYIGDKDDGTKTACLAWSLDKDEVRTILSHAKPIPTGYERNIYTILPCTISAKAVIKGTEVTYTLNAGGLINLDSDGKFENFEWVGCVEPTCFSYFLYQSRGLD